MHTAGVDRFDGRIRLTAAERFELKRPENDNFSGPSLAGEFFGGGSVVLICDWDVDGGALAQGSG
jgi:hypothetical protein